MGPIAVSTRWQRKKSLLLPRNNTRSSGHISVWAIASLTQYAHVNTPLINNIRSELTARACVYEYVRADVLQSVETEVLAGRMGSIPGSVDVSLPLLQDRLWGPQSLFTGCQSFFPRAKLPEYEAALSSEVNNTWSFTSAPLNVSMVQCYRCISNGLRTKNRGIYLTASWPHSVCERHSTCRKVDKKIE